MPRYQKYVLWDPMKDYEYMKIRYSEILTDVVEHYKLCELVHTDGYVYIKIRKGMPGLKQAGKNSHDHLKKHLAQYGYHPCDRTPALWQQKTQKITFPLLLTTLESNMLVNTTSNI